MISGLIKRFIWLSIQVGKSIDLIPLRCTPQYDDFLIGVNLMKVYEK